MQQLIGNFRTMFLFRGFAAILFGILTLVWPGISLTVLVLLFGVFAVISGITAVAGGRRYRGGQRGGGRFFQSLLCVPAGGQGLPSARAHRDPCALHHVRPGTLCRDYL